MVKSQETQVIRTGPACQHCPLAPARRHPQTPPAAFLRRATPRRALPQSANNYLHLYALNVSSEPLWRLPNSADVKRVNIYLSHSFRLDYGPVRVADLAGDAKSLLVALTNGIMQVFSWQGKVGVGPKVPGWSGVGGGRRPGSPTPHIGAARSAGGPAGCGNGGWIPLLACPSTCPCLVLPAKHLLAMQGVNTMAAPCLTGAAAGPVQPVLGRL